MSLLTCQPDSGSSAAFHSSHCPNFIAPTLLVSVTQMPLM